MESSKGRIIFASSNSCTVLSNNNREYFSVLSGNYLQSNNVMPSVGDYVLFKPEEDGVSVIVSVMERKSSISRKSAGRGFKEQTLAANVDYLFIINAMDETFSKRRIERFMILAKAGGVTPVIILSKADICNPIDMAMYMVEAEEVASGAEIIEVSSVSGVGIERVEELIKPDDTICIVGLSGAGKSTLTNRLAGYDVRDVRHVREYDSKGRHCTTDRHMLRLPNGAMLIDTPGIREVGLHGDVEAVEMVFEDITVFAEDCFFTDCTHIHEPSCAVLKAVEDGKLSPERYESYLKLRKESENYRLRTETPSEKKRSDKQLSRLVRSANKRKKRF